MVLPLLAAVIAPEALIVVTPLRAPALETFKPEEVRAKVPVLLPMEVLAVPVVLMVVVPVMVAPPVPCNKPAPLFKPTAVSEPVVVRLPVVSVRGEFVRLLLPLNSGMVPAVPEPAIPPPVPTQLARVRRQTVSLLPAKSGMVR